MAIHASPASLPELDEFLATFQVRLSPGGRGRLGALPDRAAHRTAHQEVRHHGGGHPRDP